ncbi:hypothetical protein [Clavibacter tessellarius]|uniref:hypothetical protein n=1 Tax=Clavibacter tessellarius TaxID=31965 RepID=UPI0039BEE9FF
MSAVTSSDTTTLLRRLVTRSSPPVGVSSRCRLPRPTDPSCAVSAVPSMIPSG